MIKKLKSLENEVADLLLRYPPYRDNDAKLVSAVYFTRIGQDKLDRMSGLELLVLISQGGLPFPDHITRVRRRLQEKNENLRGVSYKKRHGLADDVRKNIPDL